MSGTVPCSNKGVLATHSEQCPGKKGDRDFRDFLKQKLGNDLRQQFPAASRFSAEDSERENSQLCLCMSKEPFSAKGRECYGIIYGAEYSDGLAVFSISHSSF